MLGIEIPWAPCWAQVICGIPLALLAFFGVRWGSRNLWLSGKILRGVAPPPPGSTGALSGTLGLVFHSLVIAVSLGSAYFLCALLTTQPTIVTETGVEIGARPPKYQTSFIPWQDVTSVECGMPPRSNKIQRLVVRSKDDAVELGSAGIALEPVRAFIAQHAGERTVRPCKHEIYNHRWTY